MKRVMSFALVLCLLVPLGAIGAFADDGSSWELTEFVDDFGDPTGETYLRSIVKGTFSNTATPGEDMHVILGYSPALGEDALPVLTLRMIEYDSIEATYSDTDSKVIKIKIGDVITEDILTGKAPNGDLMLIGGPCLLRMYDAWMNDETVRFVVELGSSKYSFSVDGSGFSDSVSSFWAAQETGPDGMFYSGTDCVRMDCYFTSELNGDRVWHNAKGDYKLSFDAQKKEDVGNVSHYQYMVGIVSDNPFSYPLVHLDDYTDYLEGKYKNEKGSLDWCGRPDEENKIYYMADGRRITFLNSANESVCTYDIYIEQSGQ